MALLLDKLQFANKENSKNEAEHMVIASSSPSVTDVSKAESGTLGKKR